MLTKLKQKIQRMLSSEARVAHRMGLTPNIVSIIGFALAFLAAVAYSLVNSQQSFFLLIGVALMMASGFCDTLDGILARTYRQATNFGGFFDSLLDRYADALVFTGIIISGYSIVVNYTFTLVVALIALSSSFLVSYSRARAEAAGIKMESIGIAERAERMLILAAASIAAFFWAQALTIGVAVIAVLATITVVQRGLHVYKSLKKKEEKPQVRIVVDGT